ncbi:MAG: acetylxylan esterase [Deinococcota bacterium]
MPFFDMPLEALETYRPASPEQPDFDTFWDNTLADARSHPINTQFEPFDAGTKLVDVFDMQFSGYGGQPIKAWFMLPANTSEPLPAVVEYIGYGGGRGYPYSWLKWVAAGFAYMVMDNRGQGGSGSSPGDTADYPERSESQALGFFTQGITDPNHYYYRRLYTDAARAIEAVKTHPLVDTTRIAAVGASQGGALAIAASGLMAEDVSVCVADVPGLCDFKRVVGLTGQVPYNEISTYLQTQRDHVDTVFKTLSYVDGICFAKRSKAYAYYSTGLMDMICPPSGVYAAFNHVNGPKEIHTYAFNGHEAGGEVHQFKKIKFLSDRWN